MPRFDLHFLHETQIANEIVQAGEMSRPNGDWTPKRLEFLYELAYLRVFVAWETMLESIFLRSLCGFASRAGQESMVSGQYYRNIASAEAAILGSRTYRLWHNPSELILRFQSKLVSPAAGGLGLQETVISSNQVRLKALADIRHRIVHDQTDAKMKFDAATRLIAGRRYPASRPGKFLRANQPNSSPPRKWIDVIISELTGLAGQMV